MGDYGDVVAYLRSKGAHVKSEGFDEARVTCFFHGEDPGDRGRLYVKTAPEDEIGLYHCKVCDERGNIVTLMRHFGDEQERAIDDDSHERYQILQAAAAYYQSNLGADQVRWLREERGLSVETIRSHQIGWADGGLCAHLKGLGFEIGDMLRTGLIAVESGAELQENGTFTLGGSEKRPYDFLRDCITIPYHVAGNVVQIRGKKIEGKYLTPNNRYGTNPARLFNTDAVWGAETVVICEGEFDSLVTEQMGYRAVGVPGSATWQDAWDGYFEPCRRVFIVFDNDAAGAKGANVIREHVGRKTRVVEMPDLEMKPGDNDVSEMFGKRRHSAEEFAALLAAAERAGTLLVTVREAFAEWKDLQGRQGLRYGFEELDDLIRPGHLDAQVAVMLAKTNVGKTLSLLNVFQRIRMDPGQEDAKILFVSLEQTRGDWFERARRIWNFYNLDCPPEEVHENCLRYWEDNLYIVDVGRIGVEPLLGAIDDFREFTGQLPDFVAIDYLGYWARSFKGQNRYEQVSEAIMALKEGVAKEKRVRIFAPHQVSRTQSFGGDLDLDSGRDSGAIEETADMMYLLWNPDTRKGTAVEDRTGRVNLRIGKSRHGGKGHIVNLQFGYLTLTLVPFSDSRSAMAADELAYEMRDDCSTVVEPWEAAIFRHKSGIKTGDISRLLMDERQRH